MVPPGVRRRSRAGSGNENGHRRRTPADSEGARPEKLARPRDTQSFARTRTRSEIGGRWSRRLVAQADCCSRRDLVGPARVVTLPPHRAAVGLFDHRRNQVRFRDREKVPNLAVTRWPRGRHHPGAHKGLGQPAHRGQPARDAASHSARGGVVEDVAVPVLASLGAALVACRWVRLAPAAVLARGADRPGPTSADNGANVPPPFTTKINSHTAHCILGPGWDRTSSSVDYRTNPAG